MTHLQKLLDRWQALPPSWKNASLICSGALISWIIVYAVLRISRKAMILHLSDTSWTGSQPSPSNTTMATSSTTTETPTSMPAMSQADSPRILGQLHHDVNPETDPSPSIHALPSEAIRSQSRAKPPGLSTHRSNRPSNGKVIPFEE